MKSRALSPRSLFLVPALVPAHPCASTVASLQIARSLFLVPALVPTPAHPCASVNRLKGLKLRGLKLRGLMLKGLNVLKGLKL